MVHYIPASLENLMQVAAFVLDNKNELAMKNVVLSANAWYRTKMIKNPMAKDMMSQLGTYVLMLSDYLHTKNISDKSMAASLFQHGEFASCL